MTDPDKLKTHATLVDRMSQSLSLDLQEEAISGRLPFDEIAEAVLRCTKCAEPEACTRFLDNLEHPIEDTPDYCRNADLFAFLKEESPQT